MNKGNQFGMACPQCRRDDMLDITALINVRLVPDGTDADLAENHDHEWNNESTCSCAACGWTGTVLDALPDEEEEEES